MSTDAPSQTRTTVVYRVTCEQGYGHDFADLEYAIGLRDRRNAIGYTHRSGMTEPCVWVVQRVTKTVETVTL